ncbi:hypothetical protein FDP41_008671 [Naegleria fowleri]|uniref:Uncharacterized protein n=1 Tax=Naegleria fowleri TaxID=5763 RepID=A0A6A5B532_NAEFO|nr:uncharacterized protein FDP41_008671 [Naegleria fowleri]KAF0973007.1 hypothetical protein FDP41_008671 [Naegleria fowleri]CAG4708894.1 unnamed protein product [Naegleria fowleri]
MTPSKNSNHSNASSNDSNHQQQDSNDESLRNIIPISKIQKQKTFHLDTTLKKELERELLSTQVESIPEDDSPFLRLSSDGDESTQLDDFVPIEESPFVDSIYSQEECQSFVGEAFDSMYP